MSDYTLQCSICGKPIPTRFVKDFFCRSCYKKWERSIKAHEEWTVFLQNEERNRRYREQDMRKLGIEYKYGLGFTFDFHEDYGLLGTKEIYLEE